MRDLVGAPLRRYLRAMHRVVAERVFSWGWGGLALLAVLAPLAPWSIEARAEAKPAAPSATAEEAPVDPEQQRRQFIAATCTTIEAEAKRRSLPAAYFARLIWKESRFNPSAVSPKGASGIAQFMPATARQRGLADPFDPPAALAASADYLGDLKDRFGNLGLAAAAYNAGPDRVARWRDGRSFLPWETEDFVLAITGLTAAQWTEPDVAEPDFALHDSLPFGAACRKFASSARPMPRLAGTDGSAVKPWGVLVTSHFHEGRVRAALDRLRRVHPLIARHSPVDIVRRPNRARGGKLMYQAMLGVDDRRAGQALCDRLRRDGGACMVVRNRS